MTPTPSTPAPAGASPVADAAGSRRAFAWRFWLDAALVLLVFFVHGAWPAPDVNETCYVLKAKHYWNPDWLSRDLFLSSADAHWFFYLACGWPTLFLSLNTSAWVLRIAGWVALALGWTSLSRAVAPRTGLAVLSAIGFLALVEHAHMAGEWIAGGVEGKVFSYACVLAALANVARGRWPRAWLWLAPATLFHVLIGGWASMTVAGAWLLVGRLRSSVDGSSGDRGPRGSIRPLAITIGVWATCAAAAVLPALRLSAGVDPQVEKEAHRITIQTRLPHHLDFAMLKEEFRFRHALLWTAWGGLIIAVAATNHFGRASRAGRPSVSPIETRRLMRVQAAVAGAAGLALIGIAISTWLRPADGTPPTLLRFYWFRLSDVFAPLGVSLAATTLLLRRGRFGWIGFGLLLGGIAACGLDVMNAVETRTQISAPRAYKPDKSAEMSERDQFAAFKDACAWVARKTPENSLFIISRDADAFKWYAGRSDLVNWKDFPQDAPSIAAWWQRMLDVGIWDAEEKRYRNRIGLNKGTLPPMNGDEIKQVAEKYGVDYLFVKGRFDLPFKLVYAQKSPEGYAVYDLKAPRIEEENSAAAP